MANQGLILTTAIFLGIVSFITCVDKFQSSVENLVKAVKSAHHIIVTDKSENTKTPEIEETLENKNLATTDQNDHTGDPKLEQTEEKDNSNTKEIDIEQK